MDIVQYIFIGYAWLVWVISLILSEDFLNPKILRKCLVASFVSLGFGVILELMQIFTLERGLILLIMSGPIMYIVFHQLLRKIFKDLTGFEPFLTSQTSLIGGKTGSKYHKYRKIKWTDFLFSFLQGLVPIFTFAGLLILLLKLNR